MTFKVFKKSLEARFKFTYAASEYPLVLIQDEPVNFNHGVVNYAKESDKKKVLVLLTRTDSTSEFLNIQENAFTQESAQCISDPVSVQCNIINVYCRLSLMLCFVPFAKLLR